MARQVIIHLPDIGEDFARWVVAEDNGSLASSPLEGSLEEAAADIEGRRAILVVRGDSVLLAEAVVPGGSSSRAQQAVPFALEEQLADDVDQLHFAIGSRVRGDTWPVAVIDRETMDRLVEQCALAGIRPSAIVPEQLAVPRLEGEEDEGWISWTALQEGSTLVVRLDRHHGFSSDIDLLELMLDGARTELEEGQQAALVVFHTDSPSPLPEIEGVEIETRPVASALALFAKGLREAPTINLQQGDYSPKQSFDKAWRPWRWSAALAAMVCLIGFGLKWQEARELSAREAAIDARIVETFSAALPGTRVQRPRRQMQSALESLGSGSNDGFTARLGHIADSLADQPASELRSISYRDSNRRFDLDLTTDALPSLDSLKSALKERGNLNMSVQSANREDGGVRARVRIE